MRNLGIREELAFPVQHYNQTNQAHKNARAKAIKGIVIDNAGLVLLQQFLPWFFEWLGISGEKKILQPDKALRLLHFLVTGQTEVREYDLVLPKILCGIPLATPVNSDVRLNDEELGEALMLLESIKSYYRPLRNTSRSDLQETLLRSTGTLCRMEGRDWILQIDSPGLGLVLSQSPWGISIVKLPWMDYMIRVECR